MLSRMHLTRWARLAVIPAGALLLAMVGAPIVAAHSAQEVGEFHLEIGWLNEPALVGQPNAVQLTINDHDEAPVTDLGADDLKVTVSSGGQDSAALPLVAAFEADAGEGPLGEYHAELIPTAPGDYSFHFAGKIHGTPVDLTVASGDQTFDPVVGSSDLEFPVKQPTLTEVATRLDRIDGRIGALQSAPPPDQQAIDEVTAAASAAKQAADQALLVGGLLGGAGVVLAILALISVTRASRRGTGPA